MRQNDASEPAFRPPRPAFLLALAGALLAWWVVDDPEPPAPRSVAAAPAPTPAVVDTLKPAGTLSQLWAEHGLPSTELPAFAEAGREVHPWRTLRPGSVYQFWLDRDGGVRSFEVAVDRDRRMVIRRAADGYVARLVETPFVRKTRRISACIEGSPWQALAEAGEDPALTVRMAEVLAAQVDFYADLRSGDCFEALVSVDERPDGSYRIATFDAIRFDLRKREIEAYRFSPDGEQVDWYDAEGRSLKRRFLRSPLKYTRITSGFGSRRHPILRRVRPHWGVDYAAPVGTPVQAAGDGTVVAAGRNGGYGLYVKLRHGKRYATSYAHLSRIAGNVRRGARVRQGEVIGYVGSTGLSTGPHLDYRFIEDGSYVDPLSIDLPTALPLEGERLEAFRVHRDRLRHTLTGPPLRLASPADDSPHEG
ncbi:MAG: peptidoglycan DD-metalloendopeptidase family protein [Gemmatimonadota bacterium]|nr:peptidoglycan DD-metalloendopeptidase family protein [Gemmatimonadota bacterium]